MKDYKDKKIVVGVSGGPDSMYLLDNIVVNKNYKEIIVCHVNYNLRGQDSIRDKDIVNQYCLKNNICCEVLETSYDPENKNLENWARQVRYNFFAETINKYKFDLVLIAHNLNDHVETYMMQQLRGNIVKYWGICEENVINNAIVNRPILDTYKSEILKYLKEHNISYGIDVTNFDEKYLRNKIRKSLNEKDFDKYLKEINGLNNEIISFHNDYKIKYENNNFDVRDISKLDENFKQIFLYNFLIYNGLEENLSKLKKQFLKEILKQISSPKKNIIVESKGFTIYKKGYLIYIYK